MAETPDQRRNASGERGVVATDPALPPTATANPPTQIQMIGPIRVWNTSSKRIAPAVQTARATMPESGQPDKRWGRQTGSED